MRPWRDIRLAFALLTGVPVRVRAPEQDEPSFVATWFPLVGVVLGAIPASTLLGLAAYNERMSDGLFVQRAALVLSAGVVGFWAWATRTLHWDGLGDVADAVWGGHSPARRLEIMADPRVGGFGATAIAFVALAQVASVASLIATGTGWIWIVLAAPVTGRMAAVFASTLGTPARDSGLGRGVHIPLSRAALPAFVALATVVASWVPIYLWALNDTVFSGGGLVVASLMVGTLLASAAVPHALSRPFEGVTGDVMGASILVTETLCLVSAALVAAW